MTDMPGVPSMRTLCGLPAGCICIGAHPASAAISTKTPVNVFIISASSNEFGTRHGSASVGLRDHAEHRLREPGENPPHRLLYEIHPVGRHVNHDRAVVPGIAADL